MSLVNPVPYTTPVTSSALVHTRVTGGAGVQLHAVETGNPRGRPIVFIHGFSQSWMSWRRQMDSDLARDFRLIAVDLRGHGQSDKPRDGYSDFLLWADDIKAVVTQLSLEQPLLCGWSYGPIVILDYLRQYGEDNIGGVCFVGGVTKLGSDAALSVLTPEFLGLVPGFFSTEAEASLHSLESLLRLCFVREPAAEDLYSMLGYNLSVPSYVRQALLSRSVDNDDLLPTLRKPVLVMHGDEDAVVRPTVVEQHTNGVAHAVVQVLPHAGHAPFWEQSEHFNACLRRFWTGF